MVDDAAEVDDDSRDDDSPDEADDPEDTDYVPPSASSEANASIPEVGDDGVHFAVPSESHVSEPDELPEGVASTHNRHNRRVWDRRNVCFYCEKPQAKIYRHMQRKHADEPEVVSALAHAKGSSERRHALLSLRDKGNYAFNIRVRCDETEGEMIPCRRSAGGKHKAHDFLVCDMCRGFFFRKTLWRHKRTCARRRGHTSTGREQSKAMAQMPTPSHIPPGYQEILDKMNMDDVSLICKSDRLITQFGIRLYEKVGKEQYQYISTKLRELGRLVKELKRTDPSAPLVSYMSPSKFEAVTAAVRKIAGYDTDTNKYVIASLALKLGHSLKKCAAIEKANCIQGQRDEKAVDGFLRLMELKWTDQISRRAHKTLEEVKWNRPEMLPLTEDLYKIQQHLNEKLEEKTKNLREHPTAQIHKALAEVILARLILFNRKRQGEAGKLTRASFEKADRVEVQPDVEQSLSRVEKQLAETLRRVVIRGKKGRGVPLLLTRAPLGGGADSAPPTRIFAIT